MFIAINTVIATNVRRSICPLNNNQNVPFSKRGSMDLLLF